MDFPTQIWWGWSSFEAITEPGSDPYFLDLFTPGYIAFSIDGPDRRVTIKAPIQLNQWQHIAATFGEGGNMPLYVNGELLAQTNTAIRPVGELDPNSEPALGIGNHGGTSWQYPFNGLIDEISLYSRALTRNEIMAIYKASTAGKLQRLAPTPSHTSTGPAVREVQYDAQLTDDEARILASILVETTQKHQATLDLVSGEVALVPPLKLPSAVRIARDGNQYRLYVARPGKYQLKLELLAKITRAEPWNRIEFTGPSAAIASIKAKATGPDIELQLLSGTVLETIQTSNAARLKGFLGADRTVALRWQSRAAEVARKPIVTAKTTVAASVTPNVIKLNTELKFDILQGKLTKLTVALPAAHALTQVAGDQIRDWQLNIAGDLKFSLSNSFGRLKKFIS